MPNRKRILKVTVKRMVDDSPDTSWLGEYASSPTSEFSIDRAHSEDCASQTYNEKSEQAEHTLEHVLQTIGDLQEEYRKANHAREFIHDVEWDSLEDAYYDVDQLLEACFECDCDEHGDMERGQYRYFNPSFNYVGADGHLGADYKDDPNGPAEVCKHVRQDYERMESFNRGDWCFIGIRVEAEVQTVHGAVIQTISSGGLYGIESDAGREHIQETVQEELSQLKTELLALGFSKRAIATAFKDVQEESE